MNIFHLATEVMEAKKQNVKARNNSRETWPEVDLIKCSIHRIK